MSYNNGFFHFSGGCFSFGLVLPIDPVPFFIDSMFYRPLKNITCILDFANPHSLFSTTGELHVKEVCSKCQFVKSKPTVCTNVTNLQAENRGTSML